MKLLIVTQYFYPENFRINDLALALKQKGHQITVFTGKPNYPEGEFYKGYSFFSKSKEIYNEIRIIRTPLFPRKRGHFRLILNYLSFAVFSSIKAVFCKLDSYDAVYVFGTSPITVAFPAIIIKKRLSIPMLMNVQDLWPDSVVAITGWKSSLITKPLDFMVKYIYSKCDLILAASKSFVPEIQKYLKEEQKKKVVFWPQYSVVSKAEEDKVLFEEEYFHIVFTGNLGEAQGLELVIQAAQKLRDTKIRWHLIGNGRHQQTLKQMVKSNNLEQFVRMYDRKPEKEIPYYLKSADAALLILKPNPLFELTLPAKLQTYLSCGVPILGCVNGEPKRLIQEENVGIVCNSITADELAEKALQFSLLSKQEIEIIKNNALYCSKKYFDKDILIKQLEKYIEHLR